MSTIFCGVIFGGGQFVHLKTNSGVRCAKRFGVRRQPPPLSVRPHTVTAIDARRSPSLNAGWQCAKLWEMDE